MKKGDSVEFEYWKGPYKFKMRGTYMGNNGLADIVRVKNVYYWLEVE